MTDIPTYEVYAIRYAEQLERADGATYLGGDPTRMIRGLDFFTYAIIGNGQTFVVDTGFNPDLSGEGGRNFLESPAESLSKIGIKASSVEHVLLTHAHFDHIGHSDQLRKKTGATIHLQKDDLFLYNLLPQQALFFGETVLSADPVDAFIEDNELFKSC